VNASKTLTVSPAGEREILLTRDFDAPRELVWDAFTKCDLIKRWYGPPGWNLVECDMDVRVGGAYRWVSRSDEGESMTVVGEFREVTRPERIVMTERFDEAWYEGESTVTTVFSERDGVTTMAATQTFVSKEARDSVLSSGMESGAGASYVRLDAVLEKLGSK
jgi:uncharacterized protein YndB with AHSA1/START domain